MGIGRQLALYILKPEAVLVNQSRYGHHITEHVVITGYPQVGLSTDRTAESLGIDSDTCSHTDGKGRRMLGLACLDDRVFISTVRTCGQ